MRTQVIIPAAGSGTRLKSKVAKPLVLLNGVPLIVHTVKIFAACKLVDSIIVAVEKKYLHTFEALFRKYKVRKISYIVAGGKTRCESVSNALKAVDLNTDIVAVHDGARPLVSMKIIEAAIKQCYKEKAVIVAVPVKPTIKRVNAKSLTVEETLDRRTLWEVQTPQVFKKDILVSAHQRNRNLAATDDAFLVEHMGVKVKVVQGDYRNIKVTTSEDLLIAEAFLKLFGNGR